METTHTGSRALVKLLAIIGFFAILALFAWLIVQGVRAFPQAFSSLASIAETVGGYRGESELAFTVDKNIVNSGETFTLSWTNMGKGSYTFTHACADAAEVRIRTDEGIYRTISCMESLTLPENAHGLFVNVLSEEQQFSDVVFKVSFSEANGETKLAETKVTVVNAKVAGTPTKESPQLADGETTATPDSKDTPGVNPEENREGVSIPSRIELPSETTAPLPVTEPEETPVVAVEPAPGTSTIAIATAPEIITSTSTSLPETPMTTPSVPTPVTPVVTTTTPSTVTEPAPVVATPVSPTPLPMPTVPTQPAAPVVAIQPQPVVNPVIDLDMTYIGTGVVLNGVFTPKSALNQDETGALRFEVKNIGTKTSNLWTYRLTLPGDLTYTSDIQEPLTPGERAIFTVNFTVNNDSDTATVRGLTATTGDINLGNNDFSWSVRITD